MLDQIFLFSGADGSFAIVKLTFGVSVLVEFLNLFLGVC